MRQAGGLTSTSSCFIFTNIWHWGGSSCCSYRQPDLFDNSCCIGGLIKECGTNEAVDKFTSDGTSFNHLPVLVCSGISHVTSVRNMCTRRSNIDYRLTQDEWLSSTSSMSDWNLTQSSLKHAFLINPHPVLWGLHGLRKDWNRHPTLKKSDLPESFHVILTKTEYYVLALFLFPPVLAVFPGQVINAKIGPGSTRTPL